MDTSQVRARILEVAQQVKQALMARGTAALEQEADHKYVDGLLKPRRSPFWSRKRGYKYIDDAEEHLRRLVRSFELLNPHQGSSIFEIGPGNCYFLVLCRELRGCRVAGVDIKHDDQSDPEQPVKNLSRELSKRAYGLFREHFGLEDVIKHQVVTPYQPIAFDGHYDAIVATRGVFNHDWREAEYRFWLTDCHQHLRPEGKLLVHFNKVDQESLAAWPLLRPVEGADHVRKLNIISRDTLGQLLGDKGKTPGVTAGPTAP